MESSFILKTVYGWAAPILVPTARPSGIEDIKLALADTARQRRNQKNYYRTPMNADKHSLNSLHNFQKLYGSDTENTEYFLGAGFMLL
jgi:hypothetical protein